MFAATWVASSCSTKKQCVIAHELVSLFHFTDPQRRIKMAMLLPTNESDLTPVLDKTNQWMSQFQKLKTLRKRSRVPACNPAVERTTAIVAVFAGKQWSMDVHKSWVVNTDLHKHLPGDVSNCESWDCGLDCDLHENLMTSASDQTLLRSSVIQASPNMGVG